MTSATEGSGPNGDSFEDSLWDRPSGADTRRPGWYGAKFSSTARKRGDCWDTGVLLSATTSTS